MMVNNAMFCHTGKPVAAIFTTKQVNQGQPLLTISFNYQPAIPPPSSAIPSHVVASPGSAEPLSSSLPSRAKLPGA